MSPQEPPKTIQTTRLLLLPPPSPPKEVTQALQELSIAAGVDQETQVQSTGSPPATVTLEEKQEEEKEETKYKEEFAIQTLVELPKTGTPTKSLQQPSTDMLALQVRTLGSSSTRVARTIHYGIPKLDEEIKIPYYDSRTLTKEKMNEIQSAVDRKRRQETMRKEHKYK